MCEPHGTPILPLLPQYMERACEGIPLAGMAIPDGLAQILRANGLIWTDTVTDGNCGLHAFGQSLLDVAKRNKQLYTSNKFKAFLENSKLNKNMILHLRQIASKWMMDNADVEVWGGMPFKHLATAMAHDATLPFGAHVQRVTTDKEWIDASVLHALGCVFRVDVVILQETVEPTFVGFSLLDTGVTLSLVPVAMENDRHFWAACKAEVVEPIAVPDNGDIHLWGKKEHD